MALDNTSSGKNIFISYRRADSGGETGRLVDLMLQHFNADQIFMDVENLEPGMDFTEALVKNLKKCHVMLVMIGRHWLGEKNEAGLNRMQLEDDWVRREIETALKRNIRVIPVLVDDGVLPNKSSIPESMHPLLNRQTHTIYHATFRDDAERLIEVLKRIGITGKHEKVVDEKQGPKPNWLKLAGITVLVFAAGWAIWNWVNKTPDTPPGKANITLPDTATVVTVPGTIGVDTTSPKPNNQPTLEPLEVLMSKPFVGLWRDSSGQFTISIKLSGDSLLMSRTNKDKTQWQGVGRVSSSRQLSFTMKSSDGRKYPGRGTMPDDNTIQGSFTISTSQIKLVRPFVWKRTKGVLVDPKLLQKAVKVSSG